MINKSTINKETVLKEQIVHLKLNEYTVKLATSEVDVEEMKFNKVDLGEFKITLQNSANNFQLIALLKRLYPEITKYRNVEVLTKERKSVIMLLDLDKVIETI